MQRSQGVNLLLFMQQNERIVDSLTNYGFVVLNYKNYSDTIECVSSLLAIERNDYKIVIVDNFSENESIEKLQRHFSYNEKVNVLTAPHNRGYSGGNNIGIKFLLDMSVKRIIIATNDTVLISEDILDKFDELDLSGVGIVGPEVLSLDGDLQNPTLIKPSILYLLNLYYYSPMKYIRSHIYNLLPIMQKARKYYLTRQKLSVAEKQRCIQSPKLTSVYMLHGCFLYLTESYVSNIGYLDDNIFMYGEEDLMSWQCEKAGLSRLFVPGISVLHKERKSTKTVHNNEIDVFVENNTLKSRKYLISRITFFPLFKTILKYGIFGL